MSLYPCRNQWPAENVCHYCRYTKYGSMNCYYSLIQTKQISKFYRNRVIMHYNNGSSKMAPELELKCKFPYNMEACVQQQWKINIYYISLTAILPPYVKSSNSNGQQYIDLVQEKMALKLDLIVYFNKMSKISLKKVICYLLLQRLILEVISTCI